ncbi:cytochrome P450 [Annulohypoxylon nitens]|nr:cytochrome P450 [Annulohypoxylon nitens]
MMLNDFGLVITYGSSLLVTLTILFLGYRLLLHPLRSYPGPLIAKLSDTYSAYYSLRKCLHLIMQRDHQKYGSVIRYGPNKLIFNSARAVHDIYDNDDNVVKSHVYRAIMQAPGVYNIFTVIDKPSHRLKRRIVGQAINDRSMRTFEPTMLEQIDLFLKTVLASSRESKPINLTEHIGFLACDIIALLSLGFPLRLQTDPENRWMVDGMFRANYLANVRVQQYRLHQFRVFSLLRYLTRDVRERWKRLLEKMIITRSSEDKHIRHDLYSIAAEANSQGETIRMSEIWSEVITFFPAGAFSTSAAICALFFYLSRNPECYRKLAHELRSTFNSASEIRAGPQLSSCMYLRACIDEALRIAPPVPGTLWREASPELGNKPLVIDGHVVPPGTQIGVNTYTIHHNEEYFPDAYSFKPERWLASETPEAQRKLMNEAFCPFSVGDRGCAGKPMAYLEASLVLAKTLWYFDFKSAPGKLSHVGGGSSEMGAGRNRVDEYQLYNVIAGQHDGPYLVFTPRGDISGL